MVLNIVKGILGTPNRSNKSRESKIIEEVEQEEKQIEAEEQKLEEAEKQKEADKAEKIASAIEEHFADAETDLEKLVQMEKEDLSNMLKVVVRAESKEKQQVQVIENCLEEFKEIEEIESAAERILNQVEQDRKDVSEAQINYLIDTSSMNRPNIKSNYEEIFNYIGSNIGKVSSRDIKSLYEIIENKLGGKKGPLVEGLNMRQSDRKKMTASKDDLATLALVFSWVADADGYRPPLNMSYDEKKEIEQDLQIMLKHFKNIHAGFEKLLERESEILEMVGQTHEQMPTRLQEIKAELIELEELRKELKRFDQDLNNLEKLAGEDPRLENREQKLIRNLNELEKHTAGDFGEWVERAERLYVEEEGLNRKEVKELNTLLDKESEIISHLALLQKHAGSRDIDMSAIGPEAEDEIRAMYKMTKEIRDMTESLLEKDQKQLNTLKTDIDFSHSVKRKIQVLES